MAILLLSIHALSVSAHLGFVHKPRRVLETDHYRYLEMARDPHAELAREPPFCWRVLVPFLARVLAHTGLNLNAAFYLITNASLLAFLVMVFQYLRQLGFGVPQAMLGLALTGLMQGAVRWYEYQYWMTDPAALLLLVLALCFLQAGRTVAVGLTAVVAALVRETSLIFFPFVFVREWRQRSFGRALAKTAGLALAPVLILILLRIFIQPIEPTDFRAVLTDALSFRLRHLSDNQPYVLTVGTWGVLLPLSVLFPRRIAALAARHLEHVALFAAVYTSLVLANNTDRLLAYALPAMLPAALVSLDWFVAATGVPWLGIAALVVALQAYVLAETRLYEMGVSIYQPTNRGVVVAMAAFWLAGQAALFAARRRQREC